MTVKQLERKLNSFLNKIEVARDDLAFYRQQRDIVKAQLSEARKAAKGKTPKKVATADVPF